MLLALDDALMELPPSMAFFANDFGHPREIVKNAPYTAEAVTESIQLLPDGNRIVRKSSTLLARDGAGRTRQERKGDRRSGVYIYDPMDGRSIVLNESSRTATRISRVPEMPSPPEPPMPAMPAMPPVPPKPSAAAVPPSASAVAVQPGRVIVRGDAAAAMALPTAKMFASRHSHRPRRARRRHPRCRRCLRSCAGGAAQQGKRSLALRIRRHQADGTMTSHTIPAGEIGNESRSR
jgi:hypothetical protein